MKDNLTVPYRFLCFTENAEGLDPNIVVKELKNKWGGWWSKVNIFNPDYYNSIEGTVLYIDLDMIVTGNIDDLAKY